MSSNSAPVERRNWWIPLGLGVSAVSAAASSFDALRLLAAAVGWSWWLAPALPATIDALAITATGVRITGNAEFARVRRFARTCALLAILMSIGGNAAWHLYAAGLLQLGFGLVLVVGATPPVVLGLCSHLAALRRTAVVRAVPVETVVKDSPGVSFEDGSGDGLKADPPDRPEQAAPGKRAAAKSVRSASRRRRTENELLAGAAKAEAQHRQLHGRPITRDALRKKLRVSGTRASELLRRLRDQPEPSFVEAVDKETETTTVAR